MRLFGLEKLPAVFRTLRQQDPETVSGWSWAETWAGLRAGLADAGAALDPRVTESQARDLWDESGQAPKAPPARAGRADRAGQAEPSGRWPWSRKPAPAPAPSPAELERQRLQDQIAALEAERAAQVRAAAEREAQAFALQLISSGRAFPAERAAIVDAHMAIALGMGGGEMLAQLERSYTSRPSHVLALDLVPGGDGGELPADPKPGRTITRERRDALLAMSNLGRATLASREK